MATRSNITKAEAEEILGITGCGTYDAGKLRDVYRALAKENHPDAVTSSGGDKGAAEERMSDINAAYSYLNSMFKQLGRTSLVAEDGAAAQPVEDLEEPAGMTPEERAAWWSARAAETIDRSAAMSNPAAYAAYTAYHGHAPEEDASDFNRERFNRACKEMGIDNYYWDNSWDWPFWLSALYELLDMDAVWRVIWIVAAFAMFPLIGGPTLNSELAQVEGPAVFAIIAFMGAALINLFTGALTKPLNKSASWLVEKIGERLFEKDDHDDCDPPRRYRGIYGSPANQAKWQGRYGKTRDQLKAERGVS